MKRLNHTISIVLLFTLISFAGCITINQAPKSTLATMNPADELALVQTAEYAYMADHNGTVQQNAAMLVGTYIIKDYKLHGVYSIDSNGKVTQNSFKP